MHILSEGIINVICILQQNVMPLFYLIRIGFFVTRKIENEYIIIALIESIFLALFVKLQTYTHRLFTYTNAHTHKLI
jgi:hypothetical protein